MIRTWRSYCQKEISIAPLAVFRLLFGLIMAISVMRFLVKGWVHDLYIKPEFYFSYYGFEWVKPLPGSLMYLVFGLLFIAALGILLGWFYRVSAVVFFLLFTYIELIDKTNYLNHYYFVSLISFLLIWLPANRFFSVDACRNPASLLRKVPRWMIGILKGQLAIVYIYAGIAKLNPQWLLEALPLKIWLPAHNHIPVVGAWLAREEIAYLFSWAGALYDLVIVFLLLSSRTRSFGFLLVVMFHLLTFWLFPIGMFPFIMIACTTIFFSGTLHEKIIRRIQSVFNFPEIQDEPSTFQRSISPSPVVTLCLILFFFFQLSFPWRFMLYPGNLFWTEQGYRFSWRVMLMEKAGYVIFHVTDPVSGRSGQVMPSDYLTAVQEKMMSTQPDMIVQFAHFIESEYKKKGIPDPEVRAEAYVTLNGSGSRPFIDSTVDLTKHSDGFQHKDWILAYR